MLTPAGDPIWHVISWNDVCNSKRVTSIIRFGSGILVEEGEVTPRCIAGLFQKTGLATRLVCGHRPLLGWCPKTRMRGQTRLMIQPCIAPRCYFHPPQSSLKMSDLEHLRYKAQLKGDCSAVWILCQAMAMQNRQTFLLISVQRWAKGYGNLTRGFFSNISLKGTSQLSKLHKGQGCRGGQCNVTISKNL